MTSVHGHCPKCYTEFLDDKGKPLITIHRWAEEVRKHDEICKPSEISKTLKEGVPKPLDGKAREFWLRMSEPDFDRSKEWIELKNDHPQLAPELDDEWNWQLLFKGLFPHIQGHRIARECPVSTAAKERTD
jgi:hypothetical protein